MGLIRGHLGHWVGLCESLVVIGAHPGSLNVIGWVIACYWGSLGLFIVHLGSVNG